jgi:hypothetical protein
VRNSPAQEYGETLSMPESSGVSSAGHTGPLASTSAAALDVLAGALVRRGKQTRHTHVFLNDAIPMKSLVSPAIALCIARGLSGML